MVKSRGKMPKGRSPWRKYYTWLDNMNHDMLNDSKMKQLSTAICNICGKTVRTSGNTTNLKKHLEHVHNEVYAKENEQLLSSLPPDEGELMHSDEGPMDEKMFTYNLDYNDYNANLSEGLHYLLASSEMSDITLAVEGQYFKAHQVILSMFSSYFRELFRVNPSRNTIFFMKNVKHRIMKNLLTFMYEGKVEIPSKDFQLFVETATELKIKGLTEEVNRRAEVPETYAEVQITPNQTQYPPSMKRYSKSVTSAKPNKRSKCSPGMPVHTPQEESALPMTSQTGNEPPDDTYLKVRIKREEGIDITDNGIQLDDKYTDLASNIPQAQAQINPNETAIANYIGLKQVANNILGYPGSDPGHTHPRCLIRNAREDMEKNANSLQTKATGSSLQGVLGSSSKELWNLPGEGQFGKLM